MMCRVVHYMVHAVMLFYHFVMPSVMNGLRACRLVTKGRQQHNNEYF
jgi:hypothetical protein